jgi:hypothetical protein
MLESILISTVFNNVPFFDPIGLDPASHQKKIQQKTMNQYRTQQVQRLVLEGSPRVKTTGFFDALPCFSYAKEKVSSEAMIDIANNDDRGEQPSIIERAFAWTEDADESTDELGFDSNHQPSVIQRAFAWTDIDESTADEVECCMSEDGVSPVSFEHQAKTLSGSVSTATTVTMNTYNTIESWESLNTSPTSVSYDPARNEEVAPQRNSPPPLTIAVLSFIPKQKERTQQKDALKCASLPSVKSMRQIRKQQKDTMELPSFPSVRSMRQMRTLSVANYAY